MSNRRRIPIFEEVPKNLRHYYLPSIKDILCAIYFNKKKNATTYSDAVKAVVRDVVVIWQKHSLPIITLQRIVALANACLKQLNKLTKENRTSKKTDNYIRKLRLFKVKLV